MLKFINKTSFIALATTVALSGVASAAIDEIIVTATKRTQTLQEIPISVSVTSGETIEQAQIVDLLDLQTVVPSLRITQLQTSAGTNFVIRGFGNGANNPGIEPSVGVYIDGVYRSRSGAALADLTTIERIEVLRGPQSTLFGKNASAGVISIATSLPEDELGGKIEATLGNYESRIVKGTVTGPLSDSTSFRLTASTNSNEGYYTNLQNGESINGRDRWAVRGQILSELSDNITLRVIADYNKTDEDCCGVSQLVVGGLITPTANAQAIADNKVPTLANDPFAREVPLTFTPTNQIEGQGISAQFNVGLEGMELTSVTAYREQEVFSNTDADFHVRDNLGENIIDDEFETFTQEFRLTSDIDGPLQWMAGAYYFKEDVKHNRTVLFGEHANALFRGVFPALAVATISAGSRPAPINGVVQPVALTTTQVAGLITPNSPTFDAATQATAGALIAGFGQYFTATNAFADGSGVQAEGFTMDNEAWSIFGQVDYDISDRLVVTLGLNYTEDEKKVTSGVVIDDVFAATPILGAKNPLGALRDLRFFPPYPNYPNAGVPAVAAVAAANGNPAVAAVAAVPAENGVYQSDDITHALRLAYDVSDDTNIYISHSTGFKATSINLSVDGRTNRFAPPEEATNIEFGLKKSFDRGYVNLAVFEQEIDNFQQNLFVGTGFILFNPGLQVHKGFEIDTVYQATDDLVLSFSGTFLDPEYVSYEPFTTVQGVTSPSLAGQAPAGIHETSFNVSAVYSFSVSEAMDGFFRAEYLYESDVKVVDNIDPAIASREVNLLNASLGFAASNGVEILFWGRNLTDDEFLLSAYPSVGAAGSFTGYANAPRTYGVTFRQTF